MTRELPQGGSIVQLGVCETIHSSGKINLTDLCAQMTEFARHYFGVAHGVVHDTNRPSKQFYVTVTGCLSLPLHRHGIGLTGDKFWTRLTTYSSSM